MDSSKQLQECLLRPSAKISSDDLSYETYGTSVKKTVIFATNAWLAFFFQFAPNLVSLLFVSQVEDNEQILAGLSISNMFVNITGNSIATGIGSALLTLGSQAYGAGNPHHVGIYFQRCLILVAIVLVFCFTLFRFAEDLLLAMGIDAVTASYSQRYIDIGQFGAIPLIFCNIFRYFLNCQKVFSPQTWSSAICFAVFPIFPWIFIHKLGWGMEGVAVCDLISYTMQATLLLIIVFVKGSYDRRTWAGWDREAFEDLGEFFWIGLKSLVLKCVDWWAFEFQTLQIAVMASQLDLPAQLAAHTALVSMLLFCLMMTLGLTGAVSSYVGNCLGEGRPRLAKRYAAISIQLTLPILTFWIGLWVSVPHWFAELYSKTPEVQEAIVTFLPAMMVLAFFDSWSNLLIGILFGLGYITFPAIVSIWTILVTGEVCAFSLWYWVDWQLAGVYLGIAFGFILAISVFAFYLSGRNFTKISIEVQERENKDLAQHAIQEDTSRAQ